MSGRHRAEQVAVDWTVCRARGICSELLPERIRLDEWGYPLIDPAPVPASAAEYARQAVAACPTRALRLQPVQPGRGVPERSQERPRQAGHRGR